MPNMMARLVLRILATSRRCTSQMRVHLWVDHVAGIFKCSVCSVRWVLGGLDRFVKSCLIHVNGFVVYASKRWELCCVQVKNRLASESRTRTSPSCR